jgi:hypothetical protein
MAFFNISGPSTYDQRTGNGNVSISCGPRPKTIRLTMSCWPAWPPLGAGKLQQRVDSLDITERRSAS